MKTKLWIKLFVTVLVSAALLLMNVGKGIALQSGDRAPDFTLPSTTGEKITLSQFQGKQPVVLFFYIFAFGGA